MKPIDRRKLFTALHRGCRAYDLIITEDADAGGGSHGSLLFEDVHGAKALRIVLVYARQISPGVQRAILRYAGEQVKVRKKPEDVRVAQAALTLLSEYLR